MPAPCHGRLSRKARAQPGKLRPVGTSKQAGAEQPALQRCCCELSRAPLFAMLWETLPQYFELPGARPAPLSRIVLSRRPLATRRRTAPHGVDDGPARAKGRAAMHETRASQPARRAGSSAQTNQIQNKTRTHWRGWSFLQRANPFTVWGERWEGAERPPPEGDGPRQGRGRPERQVARRAAGTRRSPTRPSRPTSTTSGSNGGRY